MSAFLQFGPPTQRLILTFDVASSVEEVATGTAPASATHWQGLSLQQASLPDGWQVRPWLFEWMEVQLLYLEPPDQPAPVWLRNGQPQPLEALGAGQYRARWRMRGQVGQVNWRLETRAGDLIWALQAEVFPQRLAYQHEFGVMLREVYTFLADLIWAEQGPTSSLSPQTSESPRQGPWEPHTLARWWALLTQVSQHPPQRWETVVEAQAPHQAHRLAPRLRQPWQGQGRVSAYRRRPVRDEAVLKVLRQELEALSQAWQCSARQGLPTMSPYFRQQRQQQARHWGERLQRRLSQPPWRDLDRAPPPDAARLRLSAPQQQLLPLTRRLRRAWSLALHPRLHLPLKATPQLYEYWVLTYLTRLLLHQAGYRLLSHGLIAAPVYGEALSLWGEGPRQLRFRHSQSGEELTLWYNRRFDPAAPGLPQQQPDILMERCAPGQSWPLRFVIEVKYQARRSAAGWGVPGEALSQLHRYRDALLSDLQQESGRRVALKSLGGMVVFPHPGPEADFEAHPQYGSLQRLGIGALPLTPGQYAAPGLFDQWMLAWLGLSVQQLMEQRIEYRLKP